MSRTKKTDTVDESTVSAPKGVEMYKVGVNMFDNKYYAEKFAARKGLKVEIIKS